MSKVQLVAADLDLVRGAKRKAVGEPHFEVANQVGKANIA